jgi:hypothetical protein
MLGRDFPRPWGRYVMTDGICWERAANRLPTVVVGATLPGVATRSCVIVPPDRCSAIGALPAWGVDMGGMPLRGTTRC